MFSEAHTQKGVTFPNGFKAAGDKAGIKKSGNLDLALIYTEKEAAVAGTFTPYFYIGSESIFCRLDCDDRSMGQISDSIRNLYYRSGTPKFFCININKL